MNNIQQVKVKSQENEIHKVLQFIEQICDENNIYNSYYGNIVTTITEAFNNAIEHGNNFDSNKEVTISFQAKNDGLTFCIEDQGTGFNPTKVSNPTDSNFDGESGRGLFLMGLLSDKMIFENNGSKVCFKFLISNMNKDVYDQRKDRLQAFLGQNIHAKITN